jgi:hypothetical protein
MRKSRRPQAVLAEQVTLSSASKHVGMRNSQIFDFNFTMIVTSRHRLDVTDNIPSFTWDIDDET